MLFDKQDNQQITYAIRHKSEIRFLESLKKYLENPNNTLKDYEWCFSKLVENVDSIFIPYFDKKMQDSRKFYPDFIFWLRHKENKRYKILFIDPKGLEHEANARDKAQGFENTFGKIIRGKTQAFYGYEIQIDLFYYNNENTSVSSELKPYVKVGVEGIFKEVKN